MDEQTWEYAETEVLRDVDGLQDFFCGECWNRTADEAYAGRMAAAVGRKLVFKEDASQALQGVDVATLLHLVMVADDEVLTVARDALRARFLAEKQGQVHEVYLRLKSEGFHELADARYEQKRDDAMMGV